MDIASEVLSIAEKAFGLEAGTLDILSDVSNTPSWDSLSHLRFILGIEEKFAIRMPMAAIGKAESISSVVAFVIVAKMNEKTGVAE